MTLEQIVAAGASESATSEQLAAVLHAARGAARELAAALDAQPDLAADLVYQHALDTKTPDLLAALVGTGSDAVLDALCAPSAFHVLLDDEGFAATVLSAVERSGKVDRLRPIVHEHVARAFAAADTQMSAPGYEDPDPELLATFLVTRVRRLPQALRTEAEAAVRELADGPWQDSGRIAVMRAHVLGAMQAK